MSDLVYDRACIDGSGKIVELWYQDFIVRLVDGRTVVHAFVPRTDTPAYVNEMKRWVGRPMSELIASSFEK